MTTKSKNNRPVEALGENFLAIVAESIWEWGWQPYGKRSDDGIDGILLVRENGKPTGDIIHVQVKSGDTYKRNPQHDESKIGIKVGIDYVETHREMWCTYKDPVILLYCEPSDDPYKPKCWWTDLKDSRSYSDECRSYLLIDKNQHFTDQSIDALKVLVESSRQLPLPFESLLNPNLSINKAVEFCFKEGAQ